MATSNPTKSSTMSLRLLIDTKTKTVLFAEAGKEFVDFLFTLISLPVGTVIKLFSSTDMVGSLGKVYQSIEKISNTYIQPNIDKGTLLNPKIAAVHINCGVVPLLLPNRATREEVLPVSKKLYVCSASVHGYNQSGIHQSSVQGYSIPSGIHRYVAQDSTATCPDCYSKMSIDMNFVAGSNKIGNDCSSTSSYGEGDGGYVKGVVTYMVMDDLEVTPMSTISSIVMLNKFNVKDTGALQEKVSIGMDEGLKLLKASLQSKTVLTDVFLGKTGA